MSRLLALPDSLDLRPKLAKHVGQNTEARLADHPVTARSQQVVVRGPSTGNHPGAKGCGVERNLGTSFGFRLVVSNEIPSHGMAGAWPEAIAATAVVSRFVAEQPVAQGAERVLNHELSLARGHALPVTGPAVAPGRRMIVDLVGEGKESGLEVDPVGGEARPHPQLDALSAAQPAERL